MHHRHVLLLAVIGTYYAVVTYALVAFDAGLLASSLMLFGFPSLALAHFTLAPTAVVLSVTLLGVGIATLLEGIAHLYGLWYSLGTFELRLFGVLPFEMIIALTLQVLFFGLLYEVLFDDGSYTVRSARERFGFFVVFGVGALGLILIHQYLVQGVFLTYSYFWLIGSLVAAALVMLALHGRMSLLFFDRLCDFTLIASIPSGIALWLASANVHKVFAHTNEYVGMLNLYGQALPVEELALLFVLPFFVAVTYELYLDDRA